MCPSQDPQQALAPAPGSTHPVATLLALVPSVCWPTAVCSSGAGGLTYLVFRPTQCQPWGHCLMPTPESAEGEQLQKVTSGGGGWAVGETEAGGVWRRSGLLER